jgi:hypothetical protein
MMHCCGNVYFYVIVRDMTPDHSLACPIDETNIAPEIELLIMLILRVFISLLVPFCVQKSSVVLSQPRIF